jgi:hypothetical protein
VPGWQSQFASNGRGCTMLVGRTPAEQQGREDDEGKGWRLAVDVKSDLY